jgi:hypothetical protein
MRRDAAVEAALEGITLRNFIKDPSVPFEQDAGWESSPEMDPDAAARSESVPGPAGNPDFPQEKTQADLPTVEKWRST